MEFDNFKPDITNTWPLIDEIQNETNETIYQLGKLIIKDGILKEIKRLLYFPLYDKEHSKYLKNCEGIGHIALQAITSAIDSISAFQNGGGNVGDRFTRFISAYFPDNYKGKESLIYKSFRCDTVHGWNLHKSSISGNINDKDHLKETGEHIHISIYKIYNDLIKSVDKYLDCLKKSDNLKNNFLKRYKELKKIKFSTL